MRSRAGLRTSLAALAAILVQGAAGADLSGFWIGTIAQRGRAAARDVSFQFTQRGGDLGGKSYQSGGLSDPVINGSVVDSRIEFEVEALEQFGNEITIVVYKFRGQLDGEGIEVTRERAAMRNASNGTRIPVRRPEDSDEEDRERRFTSFRLERL